jgi:hypothetical protein
MDSRIPRRLRSQRVRPIERHGDICIVPLTKGYRAVIDAADAHLVEGRNWFAMQEANGRGSGRVCAATSVKRGGKTETYYLHRVILGVDAGVLVDHEDGDALNNRRNNLRAADHSQNTANRHAPTDSNSGFKGVWFDRNRGKFVAHIGVRGARKTLGRFATAHEAAEAYDAAAREAFGAYARTNADIRGAA